MRKFHIQTSLFILFASLSFVSYAQSTASKLFKQLKQQVYQIRVVDIESGDKNTIGSGFQISKKGLLATNFHVVSSYVHEPKKFRLEYVTHDGSTGDIELLDIDVIHDLAIIKIKPLQKKYFKFNLKALSKGDRIYSMGNPHDLSMLIIEGNYSGRLQESRYKKILFSGSLNPGMSGGPAFDGKGKLIGVNVAKGGEQLSFLVPVTRLNILLKRVQKKGKAKNLQKVIKAALLKDQEKFYSKILAKKWKSEDLGDVSISAKLDESLKCWGHTVDKDDLRYKGVHKHCRSEDRIYINNDIYSGSFSYDYEWITTDELNRFQFYYQLEKRFKQTSMSNAYDKKNITNYICDSHFVTISNHSWKVSTCMREYKKYRGLYDVLLLLTSVDLNDKALLMKAGMSGVSKNNGMKFIKQFLQEVKWKN
jgi:serine protease Do